MACESCSKNGSGSPAGCRNNGLCSTGGCNKMEVYDWLSNMEMPEGHRTYDMVEVRFKNGRKGFYKNNQNLSLYTGDAVVVEGNPGFDVGMVTIAGELVKVQMQRKNASPEAQDIRKVLRKAKPEDIEKWKEARDLEYETMHRARKMAIDLGLEMKISDVEYQGDKTKATFYYTAEGRVDFRELIKVMAEQFKIRIEMRQIGARQEASRLGGIGSCGRELCCSTWLTDFRTVSTNAARYQQLSLNPQKLAGQCGKLKCCLNYELDMYVEAFKDFPEGNVRLQTKKGTASHIKSDIFKKMMWFAVEGEFGANSIVALKVDRVKEIISMNKRGEQIEDLSGFVETTVVEKEPAFDNVVGQDSLTRFDEKRKKKNKNNNNKDRRNNGPRQEQKQNSQQANQQKQQRPPQQKQNNNPQQQKQQNPQQRQQNPQQQNVAPNQQGAQQKQQGNQQKHRHFNKNKNRNNPSQGGPKQPPQP